MLSVSVMMHRTVLSNKLVQVSTTHIEENRRPKQSRAHSSNQIMKNICVDLTDY